MKILEQKEMLTSMNPPRVTIAPAEANVDGEIVVMPSYS